MDYTHIPVLPREVAEYISSSAYRGSGVLVDCTVGEGGHSELLMEAFADMNIVAFDRDAEILDIARERLGRFTGRVDFINDNFSSIGSRLESIKSRIRYFLYDFGISSYHFEKSGRGFGFAKDEPLDMRLDDGAESAYDIVNTANEKDLEQIILNYGEENWARKIASAIVRVRREKRIETTGELARTVLGAIPRKFHVKNIHPATRVFQALRIAVNDELSAISKSLGDACGLLAPGGRIIAISFHSLEDRIVKDTFRRLAKGCVCSEDPRNCRCDGGPLVNILTKKPVRPEVDEIERNPRARSARLRACERTEEVRS